MNRVLCLSVFLFHACSAGNVLRSEGTQNQLPIQHSEAATQSPVMPPTEAEAEANSDSTRSSERTYAPTPISGAYLHCAILAMATVETPFASVGCRLENRNQKRIPSSRAAEVVNYTYQSELDAETTLVYRNTCDTNAQYDAFFDIQGVAADTVNTVALTLIVKVELLNPSTGLPPATLAGTVSELVHALINPAKK